MGSNSELALGDGKATGRLIIHAPNVHTGGGAKLLNAILRDWSKAGELVLFSDRRMSIDPSIEAAITVHRVEPDPFARFAAEQKLRNAARSGDVVLAFGNLPPLFRLKAQTVLFLQNRYLVDPAMPIRGFNRSARIRLRVERMWLKNRLRNVDRVIVQTATMSVLFEKAFGCRAEVIALNPTHTTGPVHDTGPVVGSGSVADERRYDFIYVSSGEPHKNHRSLIEAWVLLAKSGAKPSLALTLSIEKNADVLALSADANASFGTEIINLGHIPPDSVDAIYKRSSALVFPSTGESFGLPLLEAAERGLPIVASELDYVRDLIDPAETFDPSSARSIARAVGRFLKLPPNRIQAVGTAGFLGQIYRELS